MACSESWPALATASRMAASTRSSSMATSSGSTAAGSMVTPWNSMPPVTRTLTMPPPAWPSTSGSAAWPGPPAAAPASSGPASAARSCPAGHQVRPWAWATPPRPGAFERLQGRGRRARRSAVGGASCEVVARIDRLVLGSGGSGGRRRAGAVPGRGPRRPAAAGRAGRNGRPGACSTSTRTSSQRSRWTALGRANVAGLVLGRPRTARPWNRDLARGDRRPAGRVAPRQGQLVTAGERGGPAAAGIGSAAARRRRGSQHRRSGGRSRWWRLAAGGGGLGGRAHPAEGQPGAGRTARPTAAGGGRTAPPAAAPVPGVGAGAAAGVAAARGRRPPSPGARCAPAGPPATSPASGRHSRTRATSSSDPGVGRLPHGRPGPRPATSMARTVAARPRRRAWLSTRASSSSGRPTSAAGHAWPGSLAEVLEELPGRAGGGRGRRRSARPRRPGPAPASRSHRASTSSLDRGGVVVDATGGRHLVEQRTGRPGPIRLPRRATRSMASAGTSRPASAATHRRCSVRRSAGSSRNSKCWVRLRMVGSTFCGSVVASTKITWPGRLLEGLEQGVRRLGGQHVDLVDDVDLPPAGRAQRDAGDQLPHGVDAPVGGGVELDDVERAALGDADARVADAARLPVGRFGAVEGLGQDAGGRRLARAPGAAEQVGVGHPALADGVAEGVADVVLALDLANRWGR